jgi:hypothetical protein
LTSFAAISFSLSLVAAMAGLLFGCALGDIIPLRRGGGNTTIEG